MTDAARHDLGGTTRKWALYALAAVPVVALVILAFVFVPSMARSMDRENLKRYSESIASVLRAWNSSEKLAASSEAMQDPMRPRSLDGRVELTRARQAAAAALADLRAIHPPIGLQEAQAQLDAALELWIKSLDALESGYAAYTTAGWIRAIGDRQDLRDESHRRLLAAEAAFVARQRELGVPYDSSAATFGLTAAQIAYDQADPDQEAPTPSIVAFTYGRELVASTAATTYRSAMQQALHGLDDALREYSAARHDYDRTTRAAAGLPDVAVVRVDLQRTAQAADQRMRDAMNQAKAAATAFATIPQTGPGASRLAAQRDLVRATGILANAVMPRRLVDSERMLALVLAGGQGPKAEQRFSRLAREERRLDALEASVMPLLKRARSEFSSLSWAAP